MQGLPNILNGFYNPHRLNKNLDKFREQWTGGIRLEIHPIPICLPLQYTRFRQLSKFSLKARRL
jgi:hypothetical protein